MESTRGHDMEIKKKRGYRFPYCILAIWKREISLLVGQKPQRVHSHPSFWSAPRIAISGKVQFCEHAQSNRFVFLANQIVRLDSEHAQNDGVESSQRSQFLVLTKRNAASRDENNSEVTGSLRKASTRINFKCKSNVSLGLLADTISIYTTKNKKAWGSPW